MRFELPKLLYGYGALEPFIDAKTMEIHYSKHHQAYIDKLNAAVEKYPELSKKSVEELLESVHTLPDDVRTAVRNHGGGHYNHSLFWTILASPSISQSAPSGILEKELQKTFGDFETFKEVFSNSAVSVFGSGWTWLIVDAQKNLKVITTPNQDCPLMQGQRPILGLDVWEHAYYLKYQNRRQEYINGWWNVVNWGSVEEKFLAITTE